MPIEPPILAANEAAGFADSRTYFNMAILARDYSKFRGGFFLFDLYAEVLSSALGRV